MEYCKVWHQFLAWNFPIFQKRVWGTKISARQSLHFTRSWFRTTMWFKPLKDQSDIIAVVGQIIVDRVAGPGKIDKQPCHPVWPRVALRRQQNAPTFFLGGSKSIHSSPNRCKNIARNMWSSHIRSMMAQMILAKMPSAWQFNDGMPTLAWHWWNRTRQTSQGHISRPSSAGVGWFAKN